MKKAKERIIALDYFRGICILIVLLSHSYLFSMPLAYITGVGRLWTSAAEMFFLLSGITFTIVRGSKIGIDFRGVAYKTFRRASILYILNILLIVYALTLGFALVSRGHLFYTGENLPSINGLPLLINILTLKYTLGWADFLMYFSVFLFMAPFALRVIYSRLWLAVPLASLLAMMANHHIPHYGLFAVWQVYFFLGMTLARFREQITGAYNHLSTNLQTILYRSISLVALTILGVSTLLAFNLSPAVHRLAHQGWLPVKAESAYLHLLNHRAFFDSWLNNARTGLLRPLAAIIVFAAFYLFYQKHSQKLQGSTGGVLNQLGRNSLYIYIAQAITLPLIAALPLKFGNIFIDIPTTLMFLYAMWVVSQQKRIKVSLVIYFREIGYAYKQAKYEYLESYDDTRSFRRS